VADLIMDTPEVVSHDVTATPTSAWLDIAADNLDLRYERLRLVRPREYALMLDSIRQFGQLHPVTGGVTPGADARRYVLVDGFKRYRACVALAVPTMKVRIIGGGIHALKAAIINLNRTQGPLNAFEEALVVTSLFRDDKLTQQQIATLFGRHKSWACRRIALCERLCDEAIEELRIGLLGFATARQICRLPRGNQEKTLACIHKHRLNSHETAQLVTTLQRAAHWDHECILRLPLDILECRTPPAHSRQTIGVTDDYNHFVATGEKICAAIKAVEGRSRLFDTAQRSGMVIMADKIGQALSRLKTVMDHPHESSPLQPGTGVR
jgi:ParB-like chromosome segregation protein Spo0J